MNTLRNELKREYSQIPNELITDLNLCNGSLRVLLYLFTKPDDWNVYNKDICKRLNISEQTLTKYWKKLLASGWLKREVSKDKDGKLTGGYTYLIGKITVSIKSTETVESIDHSNNKPINKQETNTKRVNSLLNEYLESDNSCTELTKNKVQQFIDYRKKIKKPIKTIAPITAYIKTLRELINQGVDVDKAIALMKEREWLTLKIDYLPKEMFKKSVVDEMKLTSGVDVSAFDKYNKG